MIGWEEALRHSSLIRSLKRGFTSRSGDREDQILEAYYNTYLSLLRPFTLCLYNIFVSQFFWQNTFQRTGKMSCPTFNTFFLYLIIINYLSLVSQKFEAQSLVYALFEIYFEIFGFFLLIFGWNHWGSKWFVYEPIVCHKRSRPTY